MKKFIYGLAAVATLSLGFTSCSDKDDDGIGDIDQGSGTMEAYSPEESKEFLEKTATEALNLLNPEDQREVIELCSYFLETYGDLDLPENFDVEEDEDNYLSNYMKSTLRGLASGQPSMLTRAAVDYVYDIDFDNFKGVYTPGRYEWVKTDDSNDVIFRFNNKAGQACELKAVGSSNYYDTSFEWTEEDYYDGDEVSQYNFRVPAQVNVTLTAGGKQLASAKVNSNVNFSAHNLSVNAEVSVANISAVAQTEGNDSKVAETATTTINGQLYIAETAVATGNHLCDINFYNKNFTDSDDYASALSQLFSKGEAQVNVLNKVYVDGTINYTYALYDALGLYAESVAEAETYVTLLNKNISGKVRYNNTTTTQATVTWSYTADKYSWGTEYTIEPQLQFPDGTTYYFVNYFENGFEGVESLWNNLTKKYEAIWDAAR